MKSPDVMHLFGEVNDEYPGLVDKFSYYFCVNSKWLKYGECSPFGDWESSETTIDNSSVSFNFEEIISKIEDLNPEAIFFVMFENNQDKNGYIVVKLSEFRFKRVLHYAPLDVTRSGGGGKSQLRNYVKICKHFYNQSKRGCYALSFNDTDLYQEFLKGELWSGFVENELYNHYSYWADDICDYNVVNAVTEDYERLYGEWFLKTREYLRENMQ